MAHTYTTIPFPPSEWSIGWAKKLVIALRDILSAPVHLDSRVVASLPPANSVEPGTMYFVSNESGGAVPAFSDGSVWRRVTDRNIVT